MKPLEWALFQPDQGPYEKRKSGHRQHRGKTMETGEEMAMHKLRREASDKASTATTFLLYVKPPEQ